MKLSFRYVMLDVIHDESRYVDFQFIHRCRDVWYRHPQLPCATGADVGLINADNLSVSS